VREPASTDAAASQCGRPTTDLRQGIPGGDAWLAASAATARRAQRLYLPAVVSSFAREVEILSGATFMARINNPDDNLPQTWG